MRRLAPHPGRIIAAQRALTGQTQAQLAWRARTTASYVHQIERGWRRPSVALLARLLRALGAGVDAEVGT